MEVMIDDPKLKATRSSLGAMGSNHITAHYRSMPVSTMCALSIISMRRGELSKLFFAL